MDSLFTSKYGASRALAVPLVVEGIGEIEIQVLIA
jgi:hypothetical protein